MVLKSKSIFLLCIMFLNTSCVTTSLWDKKHFEVKDESSTVSLKGVYNVTEKGKPKGLCFLAEDMGSYLKGKDKKESGDCIRLYDPFGSDYRVLSTILRSPEDFGVDSIDVLIDDRGSFVNLDFRVYIKPTGIGQPFTDEIFEGRQILSGFNTDKYYFMFFNLKANLEKSKSLGKLKKVKKSFPVAMYNKDDFYKSEYKTENQWTRVALTPFAVAADATLALVYLVICIIDDGDDSSQWSFCWVPN